MTFKELGLSEKLTSTIEKIGYQQPTPVQRDSIPAILQGQDLFVSAQTGTGKTASFLLPTIDLLSHSRSRHGLCSAIILVPTRELAAQVHENFMTLSQGMHLKALSIVGGEVITSQERQLKKGVDILIATPGRLLDLYERGKIIFTNIKIVILDEADRMLDMGFMPEVNRILSVLPKLRQTLLFSATVPEEIKKVSALYQIKPKTIKITHSENTEALIDQHIVRLEDTQKRQALLKLLQDKAPQEPTIVFCNRKRDIGALVRFLVQQGYTAEPLHGDMSQRARNETLDRFRQDLFKVLITSDVAARGLDITGIGLVVNHDVPIHEEDYVHRIGRTGRAGKEGVAITLVTKQDEKRLKKIESLTKKQIPEMTLDLQGVEEKPARPTTPQPEKKKPPVKGLKKSVQAGMQEREESDQSIIGFGDQMPAFMRLDPLRCLDQDPQEV